MSVPVLVAAALAATVLYRNSLAHKTKETIKSQTPGGHPTTRPTAPSALQIDKPVNTTLRNDIVQWAGDVQSTLANISHFLTGTSASEAAMHPGVSHAANAAIS